MDKPSNTEQDGSMWMRRAGGVELISAQTAMEIAKRVILDQFGQLEVDRNEPLKAVADGDAWLVTGTQSQQFTENNPPNPTWAGALRMRISRFDGQILSYLFDLDWRAAKAPEAGDDAK